MVDKGDDWFAVDVSAETLSRPRQTCGEGARLNLERALRLGDELGGHIVTGHVDGVAEVVGVAAKAVRIASASRPAGLAPLIAPKGSVTLDGVSLTVNDVRRARLDPFLGQHHPAHRASDDLATLPPDDSSMSRSTCSPAILTGCCRAHTLGAT